MKPTQALPPTQMSKSDTNEIQEWTLDHRKWTFLSKSSQKFTLHQHIPYLIHPTSHPNVEIRYKRNTKRKIWTISKINIFLQKFRQTTLYTSAYLLWFRYPTSTLMSKSERNEMHIVKFGRQKTNIFVLNSDAQHYVSIYLIWFTLPLRFSLVER